LPATSRSRSSGACADPESVAAAVAICAGFHEDARGPSLSSGRTGADTDNMTASELRVLKERIAATLTVSNGRTVHGFVFVSGFSATHTGPERVRDLLNGERGFFPFEVDEPPGASTLLFNREHVVMVDLESDDELRQMPGYEHATRRTVSMLLSSGQRLDGFVRVLRPQGRDRLSDHAREGEQFWYLEGPNRTLIVNMHHVLEMTDHVR
jgi:hypothetical protein